MKQYNSYNHSSSKEREGASSKDFWKIYNMLPPNTYLDLNFIDSFSNNLLERIGFAKDGSADLENPVSAYEDLIKEAFRMLGHDGYKSLQLIWNKGFGNSVLMFIFVDYKKKAR